MWPITVESTALVRHLISIGGIPADAAQLEELKRLLREALEKRRKVVNLSRSGKAPYMFFHGFLLWATQSVLADEGVPEDFRRHVQIVLAAWSKISGSNAFPPSPTDDTIVPVTGKFSNITFTGITLSEHERTLGEYPLEGDILRGAGIVYLPDQLSLLYVVRPDRSITLTLNAAGYLEKDGENVRREMEAWYPKVVRLWMEYGSGLVPATGGTKLVTKL